MGCGRNCTPIVEPGQTKHKPATSGLAVIHVRSAQRSGTARPRPAAQHNCWSPCIDGLEQLQTANRCRWAAPCQDTSHLIGYSPYSQWRAKEWLSGSVFRGTAASAGMSRANPTARAIVARTLARERSSLWQWCCPRGVALASGRHRGRQWLGTWKDTPMLIPDRLNNLRVPVVEFIRASAN